MTTLSIGNIFLLVFLCSNLIISVNQSKGIMHSYWSITIYISFPCFLKLPVFWSWVFEYIYFGWLQPAWTRMPRYIQYKITVQLFSPLLHNASLLTVSLIKNCKINCQQEQELPLPFTSFSWSRNIPKLYMNTNRKGAETVRKELNICWGLCPSPLPGPIFHFLQFRKTLILGIIFILTRKTHFHYLLILKARNNVSSILKVISKKYMNHSGHSSPLVWVKVGV